ncbi:MAG TPA: DUF4358 domain-containing protein [Candidatus Galloscillospira excrementavium]|nr:DUF4358 domain-containing protein [Candidatus Galloscillospira excrementavium]
MKRLLPALLLLLALCACAGTGEDAPTPGPAPEDIAQAVLDSQADPGGLTALEGEELRAYLSDGCGVDEDLWTGAAVYLASGVDGREVIVLRLAGAGAASAAVEALEAHRQARAGDFYGYAPDQAALLENARVVTADGYAALLACTDPDGAEAAFLAAVGEGAAAEVLNPGLDTGDFVPFDPPNEYDMSLYDTAPILSAWESGEEDGLSEKDAAILSACRAIFAEHVTEDMTDFEKELALHDALVDLGEYDQAVYDRDTPQGRPDNTNPYGMLVEGYGICLGYATSFQLLMDLAGVECITVVGAAFNSSSDHAWNLVRLEGEWYAVDPTWDDPIGAEELPPTMANQVRYEYFNVTSDYLRETDHQWDYQSVPEAEGTRFSWSGTGVLPE